MPPSPPTVLLNQRQIAQRIEEMAQELAPQLTEEPVVVGLLKGAFVFTADLVRALSALGVKPLVDFLWVASYGQATTSPGVLQWHMEGHQPLQGRQVLLLDDILDSGNTLKRVTDSLKEKGVSHLLTAVMLDKPSRRSVPIQADCVGFCIPDGFVVGYGMDHGERHRQLPFIGLLEP